MASDARLHAYVVLLQAFDRKLVTSAELTVQQRKVLHQMILDRELAKLTQKAEAA